MKYFIVSFVAIVAVLFVINEAVARDYEPVKPIVTETTVNKNVVRGAALGMAMAQHHFDFGTYSLQGSVAASSYDDSEAASFAIGKRFDRVLVNGSIGREDGVTGVAAGVNWRF